MKDRDINSASVLLDKKIYKHNFIYNSSYKTFMDSKPLRIWFNKIAEFIKIYGGIRYLVLLFNNWYDEICDRSKYFINKKVVLQIVLIIIFVGIRTDSYNSLPTKSIDFS